MIYSVLGLPCATDVTAQGDNGPGAFVIEDFTDFFLGGVCRHVTQDDGATGGSLDIRLDAVVDNGHGRVLQSTANDVFVRGQMLHFREFHDDGDGHGHLRIHLRLQERILGEILLAEIIFDLLLDGFQQGRVVFFCGCCRGRSGL